MKITTISALCVASLALLFAGCGSGVNTTANNSAANIANKSNTVVIVNSDQTAVNNTAPVSNTATNSSAKPNVNKTSTAPTPAGESDAEKIQGQLHLGKPGSYILYVGRESGDYAAYCFGNESEAGRAILAACKDGDQCEFVGTVAEDNGCKAPGLEADLSARGKVVKVQSVKTLGRKK